MTDNNRRVIFSENRHASGWNIGIISIFPDILISNSLEKLSTPPDWFIFWQFLFNVMVYFSWLNDEMCQICRYAAAAASRLLDHEGLPLTRRRWGGGLVAGGHQLTASRPGVASQHSRSLKSYFIALVKMSSFARFSVSILAEVVSPRWASCNRRFWPWPAWSPPSPARCRSRCSPSCPPSLSRIELQTNLREGEGP